MTTFNTGSVADFAYNRIADVPTSVSGTVMTQYAEQNVYNLENYLSTSIGTTSIDQSYMPFLIDMTVAMTLSRIHGIGVNFNWSLGEFNVSKSAGASTEQLQIQTALDNAKLALQGMGRAHKVYATFYG